MSLFFFFFFILRHILKAYYHELTSYLPQHSTTLQPHSFFSLFLESAAPTAGLAWHGMRCVLFGCKKNMKKCNVLIQRRLHMFQIHLGWSWKRPTVQWATPLLLILLRDMCVYCFHEIYKVFLSIPFPLHLSKYLKAGPIRNMQ